MHERMHTCTQPQCNTHQAHCLLYTDTFWNMFQEKLFIKEKVVILVKGKRNLSPLYEGRGTPSLIMRCTVRREMPNPSRVSGC